MAYVNLASMTKLNRASRIITDIGANGLMLLYTGVAPVSPDLPVSGVLLASLPLSTVAGVASLGVQAALVTAPGTSGTAGTYALSITGGGGSGAAGYYVVAGNAVTSVVISEFGHGYTSAPTLGGFGTAGLTGSTVVAVMTGLLTFSAIASTTAVGNGIVGWARISRSDGVTGVIDLDVGTSNAASVVMDTTGIIIGDAVSCAAEILIEA